MNNFLLNWLAHYQKHILQKFNQAWCPTGLVEPQQMFSAAFNFFNVVILMEWLLSTLNHIHIPHLLECTGIITTELNMIKVFIMSLDVQLVNLKPKQDQFWNLTRISPRNRINSVIPFASFELFTFKLVSNTVSVLKS